MNSKLMRLPWLILSISSFIYTPAVFAEDGSEEYQKLFNGVELRVASLCLDILREGHPLKQRKPVVDMAYIETLDYDLTKEQFSREFTSSTKTAKNWLKPYIENDTYHTYCSESLKSAWELVYKYTGIDYRNY